MTHQHEVTYYYEVTPRMIFLMAIGGNWTGSEIIACWPRDSVVD